MSIMKKLLMGLALGLACMGVSAQEAAAAEGAAAPEKANWPVWLSFNSSDDVDIVGVRFTLPYGACESVTGFDIGCYGVTRYMEGFQINILRNEVVDRLSGFQIGLYNSAGCADLFGIQVGLFNECGSISGIQAGLCNVANTVYGFQVGLVNRAETLYGFQVGFVNVIHDSELPFFPIVNIGLDEYSKY